MAKTRDDTLRAAWALMRAYRERADAENSPVRFAPQAGDCPAPGCLVFNDIGAYGMVKKCHKCGAVLHWAGARGWEVVTDPELIRLWHLLGIL